MLSSALPLMIKVFSRNLLKLLFNLQPLVRNVGTKVVNQPSSKAVGPLSLLIEYWPI